MNDYKKYQDLLEEKIKNISSYPQDRFNGRGIVICAGGERYFTCAWVCVNIIRMLGCNLPIQLWYLGEKEMTQEMVDLLSPLDVSFVDAFEIRKKYPSRILNGWEAKPYAILNCSFKEVLLIDADNIPVINPEFLFNTNEYKETGVIFWPDYGRLGKTREIWKICNLEYIDEPEFESGQIVIDKEKNWHALNITMHLNEHSDFYYKYIHGDKETFHMGWKIANKQYSMPKTGIFSLPGTMCQHDFDGKRIFQHRNMRKWNINGENPTTPDFLYEKECLEYLEQLKVKWNKKKESPLDQDEAHLYNEIIRQKRYIYIRVGYDNRIMEFVEPNIITVGSADLEKNWRILKENKKTYLIIEGSESIICKLLKDENGIWRGRWLSYEEMPIILVPDKLYEN